MLLLYRFKLLYLSSYMSFQGNISSRLENELVLGPSEIAISVSGVGKSNLQSMAFACTISAVTLTYAGRGGDWVTVP